MHIKKILSITFLLFFLFLPVFSTPIFAQTETPSPTQPSQSEQDVRNKIQELEGKISELKGKAKSLSSEIILMDSQIKVAKLRIDEAKNEIVELEKNIDETSKKIESLENSLDKTIPLLLSRISSTYKSSKIETLQYLVSSKDFFDLLKRGTYLRAVQAHDRKLLFAVENSRVNFSEQKKALEEKQEKLSALKVQLEARNKELVVEEGKKKTLLAETQGSEANYQKLLAEAKAQLAGFQRFVSSQGGASILSNQTKCNDWGCYYNQRDSQWGGLSLNNTQYTLASDGCLVTSMAMVMTHYGRKTTPIDINANPSNFASYYPAYLLFKISANGVTAERISTTIDSALSNGDPVVVGVHAYGGTHFVVIISGSGGNYKMHDPYLENGSDVSFTDHYSIGSIFSIQKVIFS